jgi:hypothetical protein
MTMRADEIQTPSAVTVPRVKPALWTETADAYVADAHGVQLTALPQGVSMANGKASFPKSKFKSMADARAALGNIYPSLADAAANGDGTYNVYNQVLFSEGTWNGDTYNAGDLQEMVKAHEAIGHIVKPWGKLGHDDAQKYAGSHGMPRIGTLANLRITQAPDPLNPGRQRAELTGDVFNMPAQMYHAMEQKGYTTRSPEIYWNYRAPDGRVFPRVMRAVAFLGSEMPANPTLPELFKSYAGTEPADEIRTYTEFDGGNPVTGPSDSDAVDTHNEAKKYALDLTVKARNGELVPGLQLRLTHLQGMVRTGLSSTGTPWNKVMTHDYGEVVGVMGMDGENLDVYVGPDPDQQTGYLVTQLKPDGTPDEHKLMLGFSGLNAARKAYAAHVTDPALFGGIAAVDVRKYIDAQTLPSVEDSMKRIDQAGAQVKTYAETMNWIKRLRAAVADLTGGK